MTAAAVQASVPRAGGVDLAGAAAEILAAFRADAGVPGVAACLFDRSGVVARATIGVAGIDRPDTVMTTATTGPAYSLSKVMTAVAVAVAASAGKLDLDAPVSVYLPDVPGRERFTTTTLCHLLSHASGLVSRRLPPAGVASADPLERYVLGLCLQLPRIGDPGAVFSYCGDGITIAGYVLSRVLGLPFAHALRAVLLDPLGMDRTAADPATAWALPEATQHALDHAGRLVARPIGTQAPVSPSTGAVTCADDLARLGAALLGDQLLAAPVAGRLWGPYVDVGLDIDRYYGLALAGGPRYGGRPSWGHEGHWFGGWNKLQIVPGTGVGLAWTDNRGNDAELRPLRDAAFDRLLGLLGAGTRTCGRAPAPSTVRPAAAGRYTRPTGRPLRLTAAGDGLRVSDGVVAVDYVPYSGGVLVAAPGQTVPDRIPWAPDPDSTRSALAVVGPARCPTHVVLNGLPYARQR